MSANKRFYCLPRMPPESHERHMDLKTKNVKSNLNLTKTNSYGEKLMNVSSFLGGNFLTHLDLPLPYQRWTVSKVDQQLVGQGQSAEQKICIGFAEFQSKPLALNKTNLKRVAQLYSDEADSWIGRQLLVYRSTTSFQGESRLCVRLCGPQQPPPDPPCDLHGNLVPYQPTGSPPQGAVSLEEPVNPPTAPPQEPAPWEVDDQKNNPPSA